MKKVGTICVVALLAGCFSTNPRTSDAGPDGGEPQGEAGVPFDAAPLSDAGRDAGGADRCPASDCALEARDDCAFTYCDEVAGRCRVRRAPVGQPCEAGEGCSGGACTIDPGPITDCTPGMHEQCVFEATTNAEALAADDLYLYWAEYGSFDTLRNYRRDGAVRRRRLDSSLDVETLVTGLDGPVELEVSTTHLYISENRHPAEDSVLVEAIVRAPLGGGAAELLEQGTRIRYECPSCFVASGDRAFYPRWEGGLAVAILVSSGGVSTPFVTLDTPLRGMSSDGAHLYYMTRPVGESIGEVWQIPFGGGAAERVAVVEGAEGNPWVVAGDDIVAVEGRSNYLRRTPISGGVWTRFSAINAAMRDWVIWLATSSRYWIAQSGVEIVSGSLDSDSVSLLTRREERIDDAVSTPNGVFFLVDGAIHRVVAR